MTPSKTADRRWTLVASIVALATVGAGCGGESTPSAPTTVATPTPSSPTTGSSLTTSSTGASRTTASSLTTSSTGATRTPASTLGFGQIAFSITRADGSTPAAEYCALLAESEQRHARGLMGFRDLAGYDAMIFRFPSDSTGAFYMRNVPVGLSIAWFAADGRFVSSTDMAPCADQDGCPTYAPAGPYRLAIEVLAGGLGRLGATEGSTLAVGGPCRT
ncbi:MAG: DUF192 domain-containing protein [Acidimicrobiales bacterium]